MEEKKKNIPLIVALSIPVLMVLLIAASIYLPALFVHPQTDFIYSFDGDYCYRDKYAVEQGKIVEKEIKIPENQTNYCRNYQDSRLFYYDVRRHESREINLKNANTFTLDSSWKSPDGFTVVEGGHSYDIFFFSSSSYYDIFLKKGAFSRRLNVDRNHRSYYGFRFLAWVKGKDNG